MPCASAFLTSDCEIPNCLAIAAGLTPALKAARTAFSLPVVNEVAPSSAASRCRCGFASATGFSCAGLGGRRPRRSASVVTAASSSLISTSSNRFSAPARSSGKKWRCCEARLSGPALPFGTAEGPAAATVGGAENRSGVVSAGRRVGMPQLCRRWLTAATAGRAADPLFAAETNILSASKRSAHLRESTLRSSARRVLVATCGPLARPTHPLTDPLASALRSKIGSRAHAVATSPAVIRGSGRLQEPR